MHTIRAVRHRSALQSFLSQAKPRHVTDRSFASTSQQPFRTRPSSRALAPKSFPGQLLPRRFFASQTNEQSLTISQRLKKLSREYGWSALGVYLALSALDFPFCFLAVKVLGTDRIGHWEHAVVGKIKELVKWPLGSQGKENIEEAADKVRDGMEAGGISLPVEGTHVGAAATGEPGAGGQAYAEAYDHGYREAEKANQGADASIWTQLALAYAIHKSFMFIRVPVTAAVTPKVVRVLRGWGWNIGKRRSKSAIATESARGTTGPGVATGKGTGVNTGGRSGA